MTQASLPLASVGQRILGGFIDLFVLWLLVVILGAIFVGGSVATEAADRVGVSFDVNVTGMPFVLLVGAVFLLFAAMEWRFGRTPGKFMVGTRVVDADGQPVAPGAALLRNLLRYVDGIGLYLVGLVIMLVDGERRRLGDMAAGTRVVVANRMPSATPAEGQR
jgi:uncharacterized RDD family membrane protein YckC